MYAVSRQTEGRSEFTSIAHMYIVKARPGWNSFTVRGCVRVYTIFEFRHGYTLL